MLIKKCSGYELEKEQSNTSEDFFNRSEITFIENGEERTLHVLYVRYFDQFFPEFTPYTGDPVFTVGTKDVTFKELVALVCLLKNPGFKNRKRVYINSKYEFASYFEDIDFAKLPDVFSALAVNKNYELRSPLEMILQKN